MFKLNKKIIYSSMGIFILYTLLSALVIMAFRYLAPPSPPPLPYYAVSWRLNQGFLTFLNLFPALALSALVIPFGFKTGGDEGFDSFSARFLEQIKGSIITAITAAAIYGLLFFLILPLTRDREEEIVTGGRLFRLAKERAQEHAAVEDWPQAVQFVALCERIWPGSPEMEPLRLASAIGIEQFRLAQKDRESGRLSRREGEIAGGANFLAPGEPAPVTAAAAMARAETARGEQRYYDAHWLAGLAVRLARPGSIEAAAATRLTGEVWARISSLGPNARETRAWTLYRLKRDAYEAMIAEDWIRAYYIFLDYSAQNPGDPDAENFLEICEKGITEIAFFIDEMELAVGEILTGAVFSLPGETEPGKSGGRVALRIASLSAFSDFSFGVGIELIAVDREERLLYRLDAPYAKIVPMTLEAGPRLVLLMRALDRYDRDKRWEPLLTGTAIPPGDTTQLILDLSYEDFLVLSRLRRGLDNLDLGDLFIAEKKLGAYGYIPQVFQGEIIYRFCEPVFFLPITIFALLIGWRFRAKTRPRYMGLPMLAVLPLVFYGVVHFYRSCLNNLAVWAAVSFGFSAALALFISGTVFLFTLSLILLSAQHS
jgi:hypothetical protein